MSSFYHLTSDVWYLTLLKTVMNCSTTLEYKKGQIYFFAYIKYNPALASRHLGWQNSPVSASSLQPLGCVRTLEFGQMSSPTAAGRVPPPWGQLLLFFFAIWRQEPRLKSCVPSSVTEPSAKAPGLLHLSSWPQEGGLSALRLRAYCPVDPQLQCCFPLSGSQLSSPRLPTLGALNAGLLAQVLLIPSSSLALSEGCFWGPCQFFQHQKANSLLWIRRTKTLGTRAWLPSWWGKH